MAVTSTPGIILEINGTTVPLEAKDIKDAASKGVQYTLPQPVDVGSVDDLSAFLDSQFGASPIPDADTFPTPLDSVFAKLSDLNLAVEHFDVNVPPSKNADDTDIAEADQKATSFKLGMSATWADGDEVELISGKLAIKGIYLNVVKDNKK
jgi:hypothetical protein